MCWPAASKHRLRLLPSYDRKDRGICRYCAASNGETGAHLLKCPKLPERLRITRYNLLNDVHHQINGRVLVPDSLAPHFLVNAVLTLDLLAQLYGGSMPKGWPFWSYSNPRLCGSIGARMRKLETPVLPRATCPPHGLPHETDRTASGRRRTLAAPSR